MAKRRKFGRVGVVSSVERKERSYAVMKKEEELEVLVDKALARIAEETLSRIFPIPFVQDYVEEAVHLEGESYFRDYFPTADLVAFEDAVRQDLLTYLSVIYSEEPERFSPRISRWDILDGNTGEIVAEIGDRLTFPLLERVVALRKSLMYR